MKPILVMTVGLAAIMLSGFGPVASKGAPPSEAAPASQALYDEIKQMDAALSDAFNKHDISKLKALFTEDDTADMVL